MALSNDVRKYPEFSACGLNCCLCPRYHTDGSSRCPGCGGEGFFAKRPSCGVISCTKRHGVEFCFACEEFPCKIIQAAVGCDSFITHRNMQRDALRAKEMGIEACVEELREKADILRCLLKEYNDGRKKSFFCLAVNLLAPEDLRAVMEQLAARTTPGQPPREKAAAAAGLLQALGEERSVPLTLNKKKR